LIGGGIYNSGNTSITNSTFVSDAASSGGEIYNDDGANLRVTNATFAATATSPTANLGSGISNVGSGIAAFKSSALSRNTHSADCEGTITDKGYNISEDVCGFRPTETFGGQIVGDNITPDFSFRGLQNNGGPTQTLALALGSPAIGAIPNFACTDQGTPPAQVTTDQRGYYRPPGGPCDIGAFQYNALLSAAFQLAGEVTGISATTSLAELGSLHAAVQCPSERGFVGAAALTLTLTNTGIGAVSDLGLQVRELSGGNFLATGNATAGNANAYQAIPLVSDASMAVDELSGVFPTLAPGGYVQVPLTVCLAQLVPFRLVLDVLGASNPPPLFQVGGPSVEFVIDPLAAVQH
jgi:hypothetical protein